MLDHTSVPPDIKMKLMSIFEHMRFDPDNYEKVCVLFFILSNRLHNILLAVCLNGNALAAINQTRSVLGWVNVGRYTLSLCNRPPRSTQPSIPPE